MALKVTGKDIKLSHNAVEVSNPALVDALIQDNEGTLAVLRAKAPTLRPKDITLGPDGILLIKNKQLLATMKKENMPAVKNALCGSGC